MTKAGKEYLRQCFRKVGLDLGWAPKPHVARILKDGEYQKQFPSWREVEAWLSGYERALKHHAPELYGRSEAARYDAMRAKN